MIKFVGSRVGRRLRRHHLFLRAGELRLQLIGNRFRDVAFDSEDISQFAIVDFCPEMRIRERIDQLHIHAHLIVCFLNAAFQNVQCAELLRDVG